MEQIAKQEPMIKRAMTIEEAFMKSESDRYLYELREKGRHDYDNAMSTAEKRGLEKGMAKGLEKGMAEGMTKGVAEGKAEIARNMLAEGMPLDLTAKITGLSIEELKTLIKN